MLDAMLLLNQEQVDTSIRTALDRIAKGARHRGKRVALYAEREFQEAAIFSSELQQRPDGKIRRRATGYRGPPAVKPIRGRSRVGSEGPLAFLVSQQVAAWPKIFLNHPGPDRIRGRTTPVGEIIIVTDFIGSGQRIRSMLDKFQAVPTVRSWVSQNLVKFRVVAAAATRGGLIHVRRHRLRPEVIVEWIAPTVSYETSASWVQWLRLMESYGPEAGRGAGRFGYGRQAALIAFSYRIPNNTPAIIHQSENGWRALFDGPVPVEFLTLFGVKPTGQIIDAAAAEAGIKMGDGLTEEDRKAILVLSLLRGRWHYGAETALSARTGFPVPALMDILREALRNGYLRNDGRITDFGYAFLKAGKALERERPTIATNENPYYPEALRIPWASFSTSRSLGRP